MQASAQDTSTIVLSCKSNGVAFQTGVTLGSNFMRSMGILDTWHAITSDSGIWNSFVSVTKIGYLFMIHLDEPRIKEHAKRFKLKPVE